MFKEKRWKWKKKKKKNVMSFKLNAIYPEATWIFKDTTVNHEKEGIIIPNLDKLAESIEKGQTPKEM